MSDSLHTPLLSPAPADDERHVPSPPVAAADHGREDSAGTGESGAQDSQKIDKGVAGVADDGRSVVADKSSGSHSEEKQLDFPGAGVKNGGDSEEKQLDFPCAGDRDGGAYHGNSGDGMADPVHSMDRKSDAANHSGGSNSEEKQPDVGVAREKNLGGNGGDGMADLAGASTTERIEIIRGVSQRLAEGAVGTSMASEAVLFLKAVEQFDATKEGRKKVIDTDLSKMGRLLSDAACRAPPSEAAVAAEALKITGQSLDVLLSLSSEEEGSSPCAFLAWLQRLGAARREPTLPLHRARQRQTQEKLSDKRQALFGVALAAPLALLTSVTSEGFPSALALWIAIISAALWIGVSLGLVMDLFGDTKLEFWLASCLSRLGMMGVTVLVCLFISGAFFPSVMIVMWALVALAVTLHALLCVLSWKRGDANCEANMDTASKSSGCTCKCCLDIV